MEKKFRCRNSANILLLRVRNYSAIPRNEMAQAEAIIARNSAQRNYDWKP